MDNLLKRIRGFYKQEPVLLYIWETDCASCVTELKNAGLTYDKVEDLPANILTIAIGQSASQEEWQRILKTSFLRGEHIILDNELSSELITYFQLPSVPAFLYFHADGTFDPYKVRSIADLQVKELVQEGE